MAANDLLVWQQQIVANPARREWRGGGRGRRDAFHLHDHDQLDGERRRRDELRPDAADMSARFNTQRGLSLIELLVAMTIGAVLIFGATQVYVNSRTAYGVTRPSPACRRARVTPWP